jgi:hypothetical protein
VKSPLTSVSSENQIHPSGTCADAIDATEWVATSVPARPTAQTSARPVTGSGGRFEVDTARYLSCGIDVPQTTYSVP